MRLRMQLLAVSRIAGTVTAMLAVLVVGCGGSPGQPEPAAMSTAASAATVTATAGGAPSIPPRASVTPATAATFPPGIYYRLPGTGNPSAVLTRIDGALPSRLVLPPGGFDLRGQALVYAAESRVIVAAADGTSKATEVDGLYSLARPSLSPDGTRVAVQATRTPVQPGRPPANLGVFVIDLRTKAFVELPGTEENEESPEWFPTGDRVLYSSFSPTAGVNLHVYDVAAQREVLTLTDGGALHMAVSPDGLRILDMWRFRIYDAATGAMQADLLAGVRASLVSAGLAMDPVHNGRDRRGSFPLDGAFSPDGRSIVFDGAVVQGTRSGLMLFTVGVDGAGFRAISGLIETDAAFTNNFNYSPLNPLWR